MKNKKMFPYGIPPFKAPDGWAKPSKVSHLTKGEGDEKRLIGIKVENDKESFIVPIIDGVKNPQQANLAIKAVNVQTGSRFFKPSYSVLGRSYN